MNPRSGRERSCREVCTPPIGWRPSQSPTASPYPPLGSYTARVGAGLVKVFRAVGVLGGGGGWREPGSRWCMARDHAKVTQGVGLAASSRGAGDERQRQYGTCGGHFTGALKVANGDASAFTVGLELNADASCSPVLATVPPLVSVGMPRITPGMASALTCYSR